MFWWVFGNLILNEIHSVIAFVLILVKIEISMAPAQGFWSKLFFMLNNSV